MNQFELHQFVALWKPPTQRYIDIAYEECEHQLENDCLINQCRNLHAFATNKNIHTMHAKQEEGRQYVFDTIRTGRPQAIPLTKKRSKHKLSLPRGWRQYQVRRFFGSCHCNKFYLAINVSYFVVCIQCKDEYHFECEKKLQPDLRMENRENFICSLCLSDKKTRSWKLDMPPMIARLPKDWCKISK